MVIRGVYTRCKSLKYKEKRPYAQWGGTRKSHTSRSDQT
jgi:hypothetical protein